MAVQVKDMLLEKVATGPVSARVYQGAEYGKGSPIVLFFHGGAFLEQGLQDNAIAESIADAGAIVVVPDYNSPLGNVFPKPLEVGYSLFSYMANKRASGLGDRNSLLLVAGVEAGGNIAGGVALKARDHYADALDGQILISPLLDPFMGTSSIRKADGIGMRQRWADGWSHYLSGGGCHPYAAPCLCSRIAGVAPALVFTAEDDPLRDETLGYADRLKQAGVAVRQQVLPAGAGWSSIYSGTPENISGWRETMIREFGSFVGDKRRQPIA
ncbi:alpha/beta hydrolase [Rhizobium sp. S152]|uniref:alpha/beta hydrolase fold domain-containing protein n=1 Tax=Rhizobium sp. S152 TaxID=3055038 RepID=UPI0025A97AA0|nr:alpha/beta hydrolase [Rhizobium sp. S152]MDM9627446.1 alpha/beta hydrolase [Rhizobium sp. S152]